MNTLDIVRARILIIFDSQFNNNFYGCIPYIDRYALVSTYDSSRRYPYKLYRNGMTEFRRKVTPDIS